MPQLTKTNQKNGKKKTEKNGNKRKRTEKKTGKTRCSVTRAALPHLIGVATNQARASVPL